MKRFLLFFLFAVTSFAQSRQAPAIQGQGETPKTAPFYVTSSPAPEETFEIECPEIIVPGEPIEVHAKDSIWAMVRLGCTVWTKQEWDIAEEHQKKRDFQTPHWVPDPSAGHYDCPDGWTAFSRSEPTIPWSGSVSAVYIEPHKDKKGHVLGEQPPPPICIRDAK
jgi:hypothetical protein